MNPGILLSLLADLQQQILTLRQQISEKDARIAQLEARPEPTAK